MIEGLLGANPKQLNSYIAGFKDTQDQIKKATDADMKRKLDDWEKHGKDIAFMLVSGLASTVAQATMREGFKTYVTDTFGDVLEKQMAAEVAAAVKAAMDTVNAAGVVPDAKGGSGDGKGGDGKDGPKGTKPLTRLERLTKQINSTQKEIQSITKQVKQAGAKAVSVRSPGGSHITGAEQRVIERLQDDKVKLQRRIRSLRENRQILTPGPGERRIIGEQLNRFRRETPGQKMVTINYGGDQVTIRADGATVNSVMKALNKAAFRKKNKRRTGGV
jgi:hypothetical protein